MKKEGEILKKIVGVVLMIFLSLVLTACGNKVSVEDLKANDWQMDMEENKEDINFKVSFSDHIMTWAPDMSTMKSEASNEWEKMGEDLGKQIAENIKYKVEYELNGKKIHLKEDDLKLDDDYTIEKKDKNIVLTPDKKDGKKLVLTPYSKRNTEKESSNTKTPPEKKKTVDLNNLIDKFKNDGLEVNEPRKMTKDDYGMAPLKAKEGMIFGVQLESDGEYQNARIFSFKTIDDLNDTKKYYDDLGKESSMTFSYTAANEDKLVLMQFNGDFPKEVVDKDVDNADLTLTPVSFDTSSQDTQVDNTNISTDAPSPEQQQTKQEQTARQQDQVQQTQDQQQQANQQTQQDPQQSDTQNDANAKYGTVQHGEGPQQNAGRYGISVDELFGSHGFDITNCYFDPGQQIRVQ